VKVSNRHRARELVVQGIYAWQLSGNSIDQIELSLATSNDMKKVDMPLFQRLLRGVGSQANDLDSVIKPYLGRLPEELDPIEKAILRVATFELKECLDVPYKVVINEAVELAKTFGAQESHKFINGALDKAIKTLREHER
jgi:N utilization substance protein B